MNVRWDISFSGSGTITLVNVAGVVRRHKTLSRSVVEGLFHHSRFSIASTNCDKQALERGSTDKRGRQGVGTVLSGKEKDSTWKSVVKAFCRVASSYRMQPTAQMSTLLLYEATSLSNSGARYPEVPLQYRVVLHPFDVPSEVSPKSAIFQRRLPRE